MGLTIEQMLALLPLLNDTGTASEITALALSLLLKETPDEPC